MAPNIPRNNTVALHFAKKNTRLQVNMFSIIAVITITFDISYFLPISNGQLRSAKRGGR